MPAAPPPAWMKPTVNVVVIGLVLLYLVWYIFKKDTTVVTPDPAACECDYENQRRILDRQKEVETLMDSINRQLPKLDPNAMYSKSLYEDVRAFNLARVQNATRELGLQASGGGETDWTDCKPRIPENASKCIQASFLAHENVHQRECLAYYKAHGRFGDWKKAKTMVEFLQEDLEGYQAELDYLKNALPRAMAPCLGNYPGAESKEEQQQRLAGSKRRLTEYVAGLGIS